MAEPALVSPWIRPNGIGIDLTLGRRDSCRMRHQLRVV